MKIVEARVRLELLIAGQKGAIKYLEDHQGRPGYDIRVEGETSMLRDLEKIYECLREDEDGQ